MRQTCERIGCGLDVAVVYGTVPGRDGSLTLWIDAFRPDVSAAREREIMGYVCLKHGERLSPPRGWLVDDRRESAPRLFRPQSNHPQPNLTVVRDKAPRTRKDRVRDLPRPSLFAESTPVAEKPVVAQPVVESPDVETPASETSVVAQPIVEKPIVEKPLVEQPVVEQPHATRVDAPVDPTGDETRSWEPFFDPDDDLDGMLNATGSMLRDAFRSRHNGRRNG
ncbi:MAG: hypothetical protein ACO27U_06865 [Ilumatobacteraceae bacterium]